MDGGREEVTKYAAELVAAFPDLQYPHVDVIAEGDWVAARWTFTGTHRGELAGIPPTGKQVSCTGMNFFRVAGGKLVEGHTEVAFNLVIRQIRDAAQESQSEA